MHDDPGAPPTPATPPTPPTPPGERRLARPPSDRYRRAGASDVTDPASGRPAEAGRPTDPPSGARGLAFGLVAAIVGAAVIVVLGGVLAISAGLLIIAVAIGYGVATGMLVGLGKNPAIRWRWVPPVMLAVAAILLGQLGLWLFARTEGGVLGPPDYLAQTFGILVPLQVVFAAVAAWWTAR